MISHIYSYVLYEPILKMTKESTNRSVKYDILPLVKSIAFSILEIDSHKE